MLLAPKKPAIPRVLRKISAASAGSAIGPPWQSTRTSGRDAFAASAIARTRRAPSSRSIAVRAPIIPLVVRPRWGTRMSAPALPSAVATAPRLPGLSGRITRSRKDTRHVPSLMDLAGSVFKGAKDKRQTRKTRKAQKKQDETEKAE